MSTSYFYAGPLRIGSSQGSNISTYHQDHLGGTAVVTNSSATSIQVYDYAPFGEEVINEKTTTADAAYSFTGKELEDDTGLYYFEARWYNPSLGRFVSEDPAQYSMLPKLIGDPQQLNFYSYTRNNPANVIDPLGLYIVETGQIEKNDKKEDITKGLSNALGIDVTWSDVVQTGFYDTQNNVIHLGEDLNPEDIVGWTTLADASTKDVTSQLDTLNEMTANYLEDSSVLEFMTYFYPGEPGDLKVSNWSLFGLNSNGKRENWAYIYHDKLIRYDAPGAIHLGYVAEKTGMSLSSIFLGSNFINFPEDDPYDRDMQAHGYFQTWDNQTSTWQSGW